MRKLWPLALMTLVLVGCSDDQHPGHTAAETKALDDYNKMTPEQKIEAAQNSPQPQGAKDALIKKIKEENGMK